jgi:hypothetical protein
MASSDCASCMGVTGMSAVNEGSKSDPVLIVQTMPGCDEEWEWILSVVLGDWMGLRWQRSVVPGLERINLVMAGSGLDSRSLSLGADFWLAQAAESVGFAMPLEPLNDWRPTESILKNCLCGSSVPVIFGGASDCDLEIDVFGSAFWMLARIEELVVGHSDNHDRFRGADSLAVRGGFADRPIIDEYIAVLRSMIVRLFRELSPRQPEFRLLVSHDVDSPSELGVGMIVPWIRSVMRCLNDGGDAVTMKRAFKRLSEGIAEIEHNDPHNTFDYLMANSERRGIASAFYFFGGRTDWRRDAGYRISHPAIRSLIKRIHERGHEIGLHPSYNTYLSPAKLKQEADELWKQASALGIEQSQWGGRMHFLRWRWPITARGLEEAGLNYDSTLGYADRAGFRCGTSHEFEAYDPLERRVLSLRLRPLIAMECSIIASRYMGLGYDAEALDLFCKLKERCRRFGGSFSLLWHNSHFTELRDRELYEAILDY